MWTVLVWNLGLGSPGGNVAKTWPRLMALLKEKSVNVALLNEAPLSCLEGLNGSYSSAGTEGRDRRTDDGRSIPRPWSAAVLSTSGEWSDVRPRAMGAFGRRPNVPFEPSKAGIWAAAAIDADGIGRITCVSLYGLMDELSDASVHRSLSDISPIFTDPDYKKLVLVGGDLNASTQWKRLALRERDGNLLKRFEAYGLVDCLKQKARGPLEGCTCGLGPECQHSWTRLDRLHPKLQVDYLFASKALAGRLRTCEALDPLTWKPYSDHSPIIATFEDSNDS